MNYKPVNYQEAVDFTTANVNFSKRTDGYLQPVPNELLDGYLTRIHEYLKNLESVSIKLHIQGKKGPWYSHSIATGCFMCSYIAMSWHMLDLLNQIPHPERFIFRLDKNSNLRLIPSSIAKKLQ